MASTASAHAPRDVAKRRIQWRPHLDEGEPVLGWLAPSLTLGAEI